MTQKIVTAEEAAVLINNDDNVGFSGFTAAGCPKAVPAALAERAKAEHTAGRPFKIGMFTGASTGDSIDGELARAHAIKFRTPYQSNLDLRNAINAQEVPYFDMHLSHLTPMLRHGFLGKINTAIIEASDVTDSGEIVLTSSVGITPTICRLADKIIVEVNRRHPKALRGVHDFYIPKDQPQREAIPVYKPSDRAGLPYIKVDPAKIVAIVETDLPDETGGFAPVDEITAKIGDNVANFLVSELKAGHIPKEFLPVQSGVGNIANAVLAAMGEHKSIPMFEVYTEVIQDAVIALMKSDRVSFASGCSFTVSNPVMDDLYGNLDFFKPKLLLRSQELSNHPEIIRRLGLIATNTALEADIFGNVNSTHVLGTKMMNGIGGSGDFTRNAYLSIFVTPSVAKGTSISAIVPMVSHLDHNEHSVSILITEQGVADLRGKSPIQRAHTIIENCVHPEYKQLLRDYLKLGSGHTPHNLRACFAFHNAFSDTKDMRNVDWSKFM
ncbi:MAG: acetyl-CoA hydrolase/transferase family protein [Bacteroidales bacterium]|nr:acetyl-CoA hydrolase/transferase family protein [Bacteroidales bacterium]